MPNLMTLRKRTDLRIIIACSCIIFIATSPIICFSYERVVKLQAGEKVAEIGKSDEFYGTWNEEIRQEIVRANPEVSIDKIQAGTIINFPYLPKYESPNLASIKKDLKAKRDEIYDFVDRIISLFTVILAITAGGIAIAGLIGLISIWTTVRRLRKLEKDLNEQFPSFFMSQKRLEKLTNELIHKYGHIEPGKPISISEKEKILIIDIEHEIYSLSAFSTGEQFKKPLSRGYTILGSFYYHIKDTDEQKVESGIYLYEKALEFDKENQKAYFSLGRLLTVKARMLSDEGNNELARKTYEEAVKNIDLGLKYDRQNADQFYNKGWILDELDRYDDAIKAYKSAMRIDRTDPECPYNIACAYAKQKRCTQAVKYLQQSIDLDPDNREGAKKDKDFDNCREDEKFKQLIYPTETP